MHHALAADRFAPVRNRRFALRTLHPPDVVGQAEKGILHVTEGAQAWEAKGSSPLAPPLTLCKQS